MAFNGSLRIRIGASVDSSVSTAFTDITKAAKSARASVERVLNAAGKSASKALAQPSAAGGGLAKIPSEAKKAGDALGHMAVDARDKFKLLEASIKEMPAELATVARVAQSELRKIENAKARAALGLGGGGGGGRGGRGGGGGGNSIYWHPSDNFKIRKPFLETLRTDPIHETARFGMGAASFAARSALGMAHGMGVDTDIDSLMGKSVGLDKQAQQLSNAGYMVGQDGPNGRIVDAHELRKQASRVGTATGTDTGEVLSGLQKFTGLTGDLTLGRDVLESMAKLAKATGSSFEDTAQSAAEISNHLGDIPDKGAVIDSVMRQIAGQGKMGAIEIKDMATQMAKIASSAGKYEGGGAKNIAILGVLAQEAKLRGGATNARQAATSVADLAIDLAKGRTIQNWQAAGISAFTDNSFTHLKSAPEIIKLALSATHGNLNKLNQLMPSQQASKSLTGFASIYTDKFEHATGSTRDRDAAAIAAVTDEFKRLESQQLQTEEVNRAFNERMAQADSSVVQFNNQMTDVAGDLATGVLPAFKALSPVIVSASTDIANWIAKITGASDDADMNRAAKLAAASKADEKNLLGTATKDKDGKLVYSRNALSNVEDDAKKGDESTDYMRKKLEEDREAQKVHLGFGGGTLGLGDSGIDLFRKLFTSAPQQQVKNDEARLAERIALTHTTNDLLRQVKSEIATGLARLQPPATKADPHGSMPANAP